MSNTSELNIETLKRMSNTIRVLAVEGVQKANSGHPGMPMGIADVATILFSKYLNIDVNKPENSLWYFNKALKIDPLYAEAYNGLGAANEKIGKKNDALKYFKIEFDKLWIHGLVHLLGFDHKKDQDFYKMNRIEKKYTKIIYD